MSTLRISRRVALATATLLASGATTLIGAAAAHADTQLGTMTATPASGADNDAMSFTTSGGCTGGGTNLIMSVSGQGFPATGTQVVGNSATTVYQQTAAGGYIVPLANTMRYFAQQAGITALSGEYDFTLTCRNAFGATTFGDYVGKIWFTSPTSYTSTNPTQTATTTTLAVTPAGQATVGGAVTLTATVTPAAGGNVQFYDGATPIGTPVAVANGTATLTTSALTQGAHQLSAAFTSTDPAFGSSASTATSYTVSAPSAQATTTALAVAPGSSSAAGTAVTLTATVTPSNADGTITFTDATTGTALGSPVALANGTATLTTTTLPQGDHQLTAAFTPTDATKFAASTSQAVTYTVSAPGGGGGTGGGTGGTVTGTENITTTVAPGALVLSVAGSTVALPPLTLNSASTLFASAGPIQTVTVTDTRAGAPGWSLSGQVVDFTDAGADKINGENLGWIPRLVNKVDGLNVTLGGAVAPANAVAPGDGGALGLKSSRTLATATGLGTAQLGADLSLVAPTSTKAGTYTAVLTLTAM